MCCLQFSIQMAAIPFMSQPFTRMLIGEDSADHFAEHSVHWSNSQSDHRADDVPRLAYRFRQASRAISVLVASLGLLVFCGWAFNLPVLTYIRPTFHSMKVNTALSFLCLGVGLWLADNDEWRRTRRILGLLVVIIAGATLAEYAFHISLGIDELLFRDTRHLSLSAYPGRTAIATAVGLLLLGLAVTFLGIKKALALQRALVYACFAISLVALCGYLYGVNSLYSTKFFSVIALHTSVGLMAACLAYFLARPDEGIVSIAASDSNSGFLLRTLFPAIIVVPILIGWLRIAGQRANLYDTPFGTALLVLGSIGCLTVLTILIVQSMHRGERERWLVEEALKKSEEKFSKTFRNSPMVLTITSAKDHRYLDISESFEQWTGWRRDEVIGRTAYDIGLWVNQAERTEFVTRLSAEGIVRNLEVHYRRRDGTEMVGLGSGELIEIGNEQCVISVIADINERKRAEEALKESESRFRLLADSAPVLIWMTGIDKLCTYFNKPWLHFTGRSMEQELGNGWAEGVHPDDLERCLQTYTQFFDRREEFRMEYRLQRHDGEYRWILDIGVPRFDQDRSFVGYIGIGVDVTERRRAEEARIRSAAIVESSDDAIVGTDLHGAVTDWNKGAERLFGYLPSEAIGKSISFLAPTDRLDEGQDTFKKVINGDVVKRHETVRRRKDGTHVEISLTASPIVDAEGRIVGASGIARDITERKRAEEALRETNLALEKQTAVLQSREELLKIFVKSVPAGVAMFDREMRYLQASERWCADYGLDSSQVVGRSHYELFPDLPTRWKEIHQRALQGETLRAEEDRWDRAGGGTTWVYWVVRPWMTLDGTPGGILIFAEDITHRKLAEQALSDMTKKLIESQEQERARIARELHDDINQRLAMLAIELAQVQDNHPDLPPEILNRMHELQQRTSQISADVQALSHDLHSSQLEHLGVVAGIRGWCGEFAERQKVKIDFSSSVVSVVPEEVGLSLLRVLQEGLHNASKHSGVKRIEVQLQEESGEVHLIIRDLGKGFDVEAARQGRGLGLTSMQERVRLVNGTIGIASKPTGGTTIHVRVPFRSNTDSARAAG
jgi:PAS domain S-box-containing protein